MHLITVKQYVNKLLVDVSKDRNLSAKDYEASSELLKNITF